MIRKEVVFGVDREVEIGYNYQHAVQRNIYKCIKRADKKRAGMLHNEGYREGTGQTFKLFNYTLLFEGVVFNQSSILLKKESKIRLIVGGLRGNINLFLSGLIEEQKLDIEGVELKLEKVEEGKNVRYKEVMFYKALSPVVTSIRVGEKKEFLTPYHGDYFRNLALNAKKKYKMVYGREYEGEIFFEIDNLLEKRQKFIRIKKGGVRGHLYSIWVQATPEMQRVIYHMGLGQNSSIGCGCLSYIMGVNEDE